MYNIELLTYFVLYTFLIVSALNYIKNMEISHKERKTNARQQNKEYAACTLPCSVLGPVFRHLQ